MRIGQFSDSFLPIIDGVGRVVYNYCETMANKGHDVGVICPLENMGNRGKFNFEVIDYLSHNLLFNKQWDMGFPLLDPHYQKRLSMSNFDIVHVHTPFIAGAEGIRYAKERKVPLVGTFHSKYYDDFLQITGSRYIAEFGTDVVVDFYNHCDEVWAVSENSADTLYSYGYTKLIKVMPNGMKIKDVNASTIKKAKNHFDFDDKPILLYVGQLNWKKNILRILEAASLLAKDNVDFTLVLAGKGPHEEEIKEKIKQLNIEKQCRFVGHVLDEELLYGLYGLASLFVFPSIYDNAPMVIREAANAGTASIVVDGSSASEVITNGVNGLYCQDNSQSLYEIEKYALSKPSMLETMGEHAKESIPVAWDVIINSVLSRYEELIKKYDK